MSTRRTYNQNCPIALGLDVLGERWTLLILRELVGGPRRYGDLRQQISQAVGAYAADVRARRFPGPAEVYYGLAG